MREFCDSIKLYHGFSCGYFGEKLHDDDKLVPFQNIYIHPTNQCLTNDWSMNDTVSHADLGFVIYIYIYIYIYPNGDLKLFGIFESLAFYFSLSVLQFQTTTVPNKTQREVVVVASENCGRFVVGTHHIYIYIYIHVESKKFYFIGPL